MAKSRDKGGREAKKPKKDHAAKVLTRTTHVPIAVEVVPRKRKPREEDEEDE
jgi:hypothetical protein